MWSWITGWLDGLARPGLEEAPDDPTEALTRRVRRLELRAARLVQEHLGGAYESVFKGQGIEFDEVREYQAGDDPRRIDWNVTARMDRPYVKTFAEERELTILLVVDVSASAEFGSGAQRKRELAAELVATIAGSALRNQDPVGLCLFSDRVALYLPPHKGRGHIHRLIRQVLEVHPEGPGTRYDVVVPVLMRLPRRCVVFFISDFLSDGYERPLRLLATRHDLVPVSVLDPRERQLPEVGLVRLRDPETGQVAVVDTSDPAAREAYQVTVAAHLAASVAFFQRLGCDHLALVTDQGCLKPLLRFFRARQGRRSRRRACS
ncbi:MAG: DUF58 domain-containing protein [Candidatus Sericytochromatia bacterium]|nr:DUF58 domain-containing protein [Candidatus Sericytochromatia bacterium]